MSYLIADKPDELQLVSGSNANWNNFINNQLQDYEEQFIAEHICLEHTPFNLYLKDKDNFPKGALIGYFFRGALFISTLWISEKHRDKGYGTQLMGEAEHKAKEKRCGHIILNTHDFNAPEFYKKLGFEIAGSIPDFPKGNTHYYLFKKLKDKKCR